MSKCHYCDDDYSANSCEKCGKMACVKCEDNLSIITTTGLYGDDCESICHECIGIYGEKGIIYETESGGRHYLILSDEPDEPDYTFVLLVGSVGLILLCGSLALFAIDRR